MAGSVLDFKLNVNLKSAIFQYGGQRAKFEINLTLKSAPSYNMAGSALTVNYVDAVPLAPVGFTHHAVERLLVKCSSAQSHL